MVASLQMAENESQELRVLTAVGSDRPGLVREVSALIHACGANLEDSRMAVLGGEFALLALFSGPAQAVERATQRVAELGRELELQMVIKDTRRPVPERRYLAYRLRVSGLDHPGIVSSVAQELVRREINVASLDSRVVHLPLSGTPSFVLEAVLEVPSQLSLQEVRRALDEVAERENLEYLFEARV